MLDNFGMGEFLMLAIFALLFFGPERLPQMGARLGRWLSQLTQASKVFMTQWTEEAAAIQDAVREVQGIRDEIRAAQAEISGSLDMARQDIEQTIGEARSTVREAAVTPQGILKASEDAHAADASAPDTSAPPRLATQEEVEKATPAAPSSSGGEAEALSKTQSVLDDLMAKRGLPPAATEEPGDDGEAPAETQESEYERNLKAIQEIQERGARRAVEKAEKAETETDQAAAPSLPAETPSPPAEQDDQAEPAQQDVATVRESAFDKTQRILDGLLGKTQPEPEAKAEIGTKAASAQEASAQVASADISLTEATSAEEASAKEAPAAAPSAALASATPVPAQETEPAGPAAEGPDRAELSQEDAAAAETKAAPGASPTPDETSRQDAARPDAVQRVTGLQQRVSYSDFTKLSIEVTQLRRELRTLQKELQALRVQAPAAAAPKPGTAAEDDSQAVTMEEAA